MPFTRTGRGYFGAKGTRAVVWSSIVTLLLTPIGSRVIRPDYGSRIATLPMSPNDSLTASLAKVYVIDAVERWEPRAEILDVSVTTDPTEHQFILGITYRLRQENTTYTDTLTVARNA